MPALATADLFTPAPGSLAGKTVLITGANTGLGLESAKRLAAGGARIIVTARSKEKADKAAASVRSSVADANVVGVTLDLASLASVKSLPERLQSVLGDAGAIDVLLNNAGVMAIPERLATEDGFEKTIGVNHLGHFALVAALLPSLERASNGFRVVTVSSDAHKLVSADALDAALAKDLDPEYSGGGWPAYGLSKAANVLFTVELERRLEAAGIKGSAVSLHPGLVQTDLPRYVVGGVAAADTRASETAAPPSGVGKFFKESLLDKVVIPVDKGANTQVFLAAGADTNGELARRTEGVYYDQMRPAKATVAATDAAAAKRLWDVSERLTGVKMGI